MRQEQEQQQQKFVPQYDEFGFDQEGLDQNGFDRNGFDRNGYDYYGNTREQIEEYHREQERLQRDWEESQAAA